MRDTSDRRRARHRGAAVPAPPAKANRPADTTVHAPASVVAITPDMTIPLDLCHRHGWVTLGEFAARIGMPPQKLYNLRTNHKRDPVPFPSPRATGCGESQRGRPASVFDQEELARWLVYHQGRKP